MDDPNLDQLEMWGENQENLGGHTRRSPWKLALFPIFIFRDVVDKIYFLFWKEVRCCGSGGGGRGQWKIARWANISGTETTLPLLGPYYHIWKDHA